MDEFIRVLTAHLAAHEPNFGDGESVLTLLYEAYNDINRMDDDQIKADFNTLYQAMNGMGLREMDNVIYPMYTLCRDHEKTRFDFRHAAA